MLFTADAIFMEIRSHSHFLLHVIEGLIGNCVKYNTK